MVKNSAETSSVYAEYHALKNALQWAVDNYENEFETQTFEIIGDCKPVIDAVKFQKRLNRCEKYNQLVDYHSQCRELYEKLRRLHNVELIWVPRFKNKEVDEYSRSFYVGRNVVKIINEMLVEYLKALKIHDIQSIIVQFMTFYTGKDSYHKMSDDQISYFYSRIKQLYDSFIGRFLYPV